MVGSILPLISLETADINKFLHSCISQSVRNYKDEVYIKEIDILDAFDGFNSDI